MIWQEKRGSSLSLLVCQGYGEGQVQVILVHGGSLQTPPWDLKCSAWLVSGQAKFLIELSLQKKKITAVEERPVFGLHHSYHLLIMFLGFYFKPWKVVGWVERGWRDMGGKADIVKEIWMWKHCVSSYSIVLTWWFLFLFADFIKDKMIKFRSSCWRCVCFLWCPNSAGPVSISCEFLRSFIWLWAEYHLDCSVPFHLSKPKPQEKLIKTATRWVTDPSVFCKHNWLDLHVALHSCAELLWCHKTGKLLYDLPNICMPPFFVNHLHVAVSQNEQSSLFCD